MIKKKETKIQRNVTVTNKVISMLCENTSLNKKTVLSESRKAFFPGPKTNNVTTKICIEARMNMEDLHFY